MLLPHQHSIEAQARDRFPFSPPSPAETENGSAELGKDLSSPCPASSFLDSQTEAKMQLLEKQAAQPCERVGILVELATYTLEAGRCERTIEICERAIKCHSQAVQPVLLLAKAWEEEGNYHKALEVYLEALQRGVASDEIEAVLFRPEFLLNTYPQSVAELAMIAVRKKSARLWRLLARVCEVNKDYENAATFLTEAWQEDPQDIAVLSMLARMAEKRQKVDEAALWHRRVLEINPSLSVSNLFLAQLHYAQGEYAAALPYLAQLRSKEWNNRRYNLYWLLANLHVSGVEGLSEHLKDISTWQALTPEEKVLVQDLFLLAGERSLEEGQARAEQYILQALRLAPSPRGSSLLAAVDQQKTERTLYKKVFEMSANGEKTADECTPEASSSSPQKDVCSSPQKEGSATQVWKRGVFQRVASRMGGSLASEVKGH